MSQIDMMLDRLDEIDLALTLAGERDEPLPMGEEDALRAERAELQARLHASRGQSTGRCPICGSSNCKAPNCGERA